MDMRYEAYCFADPLFYDSPGKWNSDRSIFSAADFDLPEGWERAARDVWTELRPANSPTPAQGWKIHISAGIDNAERVLAISWKYCIANEIPFKHLRSRNVHLAQISKYAPRQASGKLVTIYPQDENQLRQCLEQLGEMLEGEHGPYILSDLRFGAGPLFVRYGGFAERTCIGPDGTVVPAIARPDGVLVPDIRKPAFHVPEWVTLPEFLEPHLAARKQGGGGMPYRIQRPLHYSNGGGVYLANRPGEDRDLVIKEARPYAGLDRDGADAVTRMAREARAMRRLAGVFGVPELYDQFTVWEHHFLAMELVDGETIGRWMAKEYPLNKFQPSERDIADYTVRALSIVDRLERLLDAIHERGVMFGDLHPDNVMITDAGHVYLIDYELASDLAAPRRPGLGAAGFQAPPDRRGTAVDRFALAALKLWLFLPLTMMLRPDPTKITDYVRDIERRFPLPPGYTQGILQEIGAPPAAPTPGARMLAKPRKEIDWPRLRQSLADGILDSATPHREDRLFPGDINQFTVDGFGLAYGAAGVLYALSASGFGQVPEHEKWLLEAIDRRPPRRPGFYDGLHGIAFALDHLGYPDEADRLVHRVSERLELITDIGMFGGLSGIGLNLLSLAERGMGVARSNYVADAVRIADRLTTIFQAQQVDPANSKAGLMNGWCGPALLYLRLYQRTGRDHWLALAQRCVQRDLSSCKESGAMLMVNDRDFRLMPYLDLGSCGIAITIDELSRAGVPADDRLEGLLRAAQAEFIIQPSLFRGRTGLMATLARLGGPESFVDQHINRLGWHAQRYRGHLAFPGEQLHRLSMDLATGSAGVLLGLASVFDPQIPVLPLLSPGHSPPLAEVPQARTEAPQSAAWPDQVAVQEIK
ncbi:serine/threonine protein kinase [Pseudonocardiaceae bacterium YIM PH 21723]|nr:serine/threonine protein kinase [Pseudonocardiaceae bacterium YIM PH 21723]